MTPQQLLTYFDRITEAPDAMPRLRRLILDLAVRGELVPQYPTEEPASFLLERIQTERMRLVKERQVRKTEVTPTIDNGELPFQVPKTWVWTRVAEVFDYDAGIKREPQELHPDRWLLELEDIEKDTSVVHSRRLVRERESLSTKSEFQAADILYGKLRPYLNKVVVATEPGYSTTEIVAIRPFLPLCPRYCCLAFRRTDFVAYVTRLGQGTKMPRLRTPDALVALFCLPPLAEQYRIVAKVDELMALCDRLERVQAERESRRDRLMAASQKRLSQPVADADAFREHARFHLDQFPRFTTRPDQIQQLRQSVLDLAVHGRLATQDLNDEVAPILLKRVQADRVQQFIEGDALHNKLFDAIKVQRSPLPEQWAQCRIDSLVRSLRDDIRTGPFGSSLHKHDHKPQGVPVWGIESIGKNGSFTGMNKIFVDFDKARELSPFAVKGGDIILSRSGTVGELCRLPDDIPFGLISTNLMKISLDPRIMASRFFCYLFKGARSIDSQLMELCSGSTRIFLTQSILSKLLFPLPPRAEQDRIVAKVDELMALCDRLEAQVSTAQTESRRLLEAVLDRALSDVHAAPDTEMLREIQLHLDWE